MLDSTVGQAVYTWSQEAIDYRENNGFAFVAVSPDLISEIPWLKQVTQPVIDFSANKNLSTDERRHYEPLGRIVDRDRAIIFRKVDAGQDAINRIGRYVIHFLVGTREQLTLSVLLSLESIQLSEPPVKWLSAPDVPVDKRIDVPNLTPLIEGNLTSTIELGELDEGKAVRAAHEFISTGSVDLTGFTTDEILAVMFCLPEWADADAVLIPTWTDHGRTDILTIDIRSHSNPSRLQYRPTSTSKVLRQTRDELQNANAGELRAAATRWVTMGSRVLTMKEKELIKEFPDESLKILASTGTRFPSRPGQAEADVLVTEVLRKCSGVGYWEQIHSLLPTSDEAIAQLTEVVATCALILAVVYLNANGRRIEIRIDRPLDGEMLAQLESAALDDEVILRGLAESIRMSYSHSNRFLRSLFSNTAANHGWLYKSVLPQAFKGEYGALINVAALNPDLFVKWALIPPEWAPAIAMYLRERVKSRRIRDSLKKARFGKHPN